MHDIAPRARAFPALAALLLAACVTPPHERISDWPSLQVVIDTVPAGQVAVRCAPAAKALHLPLACAWVDFARKECRIVIAEDSPADIVGHELLHCHGWDHDGILSAALQNYRAAHRVAASPQLRTAN